MAHLSAPYAFRQSKRSEFMVGSERMLKAHHKNGVFSKSLEIKKNVYDARCYKNLSKIQQDIDDVYLNEYVPLKEQASNTKFFPRITEKQPPKFMKIATIKGNDRTMRLPDIHSNSNLANDATRYKKSECFIEALRRKEALQIAGRRQTLASLYDPQNRGIFSRCSLWSDNKPGYCESPEIDEYRLKILKAALALTSEPAKTPVNQGKVPRRLRRSFLLTLRRNSKTVWENDLLKRAGPPPENMRLESYKDSLKDCMIVESDEIDERSISAIGSAVLKWRPSIFKNRILNEEEEEDEEDIVFQFSNHQSRESFLSMIDQAKVITPRKFSDAPLHDIEDDLYNSESSPDVFSLISERTGSSYSDYSYTTGSESYYSSETEDEFK